MPHKPLAIVAAIRLELAPLLGKRLPRRVNAVELFELHQAVVAVGGMGGTCARRAAETVIEYARPKLVLSVGIAGAASPRLRVGEVGRIREVVDVATGDRYPTTGGDWVLATSQDVSDAAEKRELLTRFGADVVDMEAAAVAQVAKERGVQFAALKAISDEAGFEMPPLTRFINHSGKFATGRFLLHVALRPKWWPVVGRMRRNTAIASTNLCRALEHLIGK